MTDHDRERHRNWILQRRLERYRNGLCTECGGDLDGPYRRCKACRIKEASYQQHHRMKQAGML